MFRSDSADSAGLKWLVRQLPQPLGVQLPFRADFIQSQLEEELTTAILSYWYSSRSEMPMNCL